MSGSLGTFLFWGGCIGIILFFVAGFASWRYLSKKGKDLLRAIESEYE